MPPQKPTKKAPANSPQAQRKTSPKTSPAATPRPELPPELIDPRWLVKALSLTALAAIFCAWLVLCLLYYQGDWQLVLHPSHLVDRTPTSANLPFEEVHFDAADTGQPRLAAWWIPAQSQVQTNPTPAQPTLTTPPKYASLTILYLHGSSGSLSDTIPTLTLLHQAGLNVFAVDYRSFGHSDPSEHPTAARMAEDAASALNYLTTVRHIPTSRIIPYGAGLGASLAATLAASHPELPALILANPDPDPALTATRVHQSKLVPIRLLFHQSFPIAVPLASLSTPKLLIAGGPDPIEPHVDLASIQTLYSHAKDPILRVTLPLTGYSTPYQTSLTRFLDQYIH